MEDEEKKPPNGAKVLAIWINDEKDRVILETNKGRFYIGISADCCSHSWIEHLSGLPEIFFGNIVDIENVENRWGDDEYKVEHDHPVHEVLKYYSTKIKTDKGLLEFEYRNSSNGYYGASFEWTHPDDKWSQVKGGEDFKRVLEDF